MDQSNPRSRSRFPGEASAAHQNHNNDNNTDDGGSSRRWEREATGRPQPRSVSSYLLEPSFRRQRHDQAFDLGVSRRSRNYTPPASALRNPRPEPDSSPQPYSSFQIKANDEYSDMSGSMGQIRISGSKGQASYYGGRSTPPSRTQRGEAALPPRSWAGTGAPGPAEAAHLPARSYHRAQGGRLVAGPELWGAARRGGSRADLPPRSYHRSGGRLVPGPAPAPAPAPAPIPGEAVGVAFPVGEAASWRRPLAAEGGTFPRGAECTAAAAAAAAGPDLQCQAATERALLARDDLGDQAFCPCCRDRVRGASGLRHPPGQAGGGGGGDLPGLPAANGEDAAAWSGGDGVGRRGIAGAEEHGRPRPASRRDEGRWGGREAFPRAPTASGLGVPRPGPGPGGGVAEYAAAAASLLEAGGRAVAGAAGAPAPSPPRPSAASGRLGLGGAERGDSLDALVARGRRLSGGGQEAGAAAATAREQEEEEEEPEGGEAAAHATSDRLQQVEAAARENEAERTRLLGQISELQAQQNESLRTLLVLRLEQFWVRHQQMTALMDIIQDLGAAAGAAAGGEAEGGGEGGAAAAVAVPADVRRSLDRLSLEVLLTLRRLLRFAADTMQQPGAPSAQQNLQGASDEAIEALPEFEVEDPSLLKANPCPICLNEFSAGEKVCQLPCLHEFHKQCVGMWLKVNATCPYCRVDMAAAAAGGRAKRPLLAAAAAAVVSESSGALSAAVAAARGGGGGGNGDGGGAAAAAAQGGGVAAGEGRAGPRPTPPAATAGAQGAAAWRHLAGLVGGGEEGASVPDDEKEEEKKAGGRL